MLVRDQSNPSSKGKFIDWRIKFWGETEQADEQKSSDGSKSDPATTVTLEDELILNETEIPIMLKDGNGNDGETPQNTDQESPVSGGDSVETEVIVEEPDSSTLDKKPKTDTTKSQEDNTTEQDTMSPSSKESIDHGDEETPSEKEQKEQEELDRLEDAAKDAKFKTDFENKIAKEEAAELNSDNMGRTFYFFIGVIGLGGLIVGYMTKHKWDGRGRYTSIREGILGARGRGGGYGREADEIDLLPRTNMAQGGARGRSIRAGRSASGSGGSSRPSRDHRHSRSSLTGHQLYAVGEVNEDEQEEDEEGVEGGESRRQDRDLIPSLRYTDGDHASADGSESFAVGSDTDEEDFL